MTISMSARVFLDTNVLVYLYDEDTPEKQARAARLLEEYGPGGAAFISTQVLQEFYVTVSRKLARPLAKDLALAAVRNLAQLPTVRVDVPTILAAIQLSQEHQVSFWDGLIIQSALNAGCDRLLTEDLQSGRQLGELQIENPFTSG
ncbi:MAG TPA: PIN domain-containing protein [Thermoanaerobaculia bacterium]|nr:PIN domain-containing protein [Thermoanaerobaculia bacterium]